jgi:hypothetical protein
MRIMKVSPSAAPRRDRLASVDALRGGVDHMALDHVRDFIHEAMSGRRPTGDHADPVPDSLIVRISVRRCSC